MRTPYAALALAGFSVTAGPEALKGRYKVVGEEDGRPRWEGESSRPAATMRFHRATLQWKLDSNDGTWQYSADTDQSVRALG